VTVTVRRRYEAHGAALDLFHRRDSEVLLSGPAGTGKSRACLEKVHAMALANPGMRGLLVRKTLNSLTATGLVTYREHVAAESILAGHVRWYGGSAQEPPAYRYSNGSTLVVGGMDKAMKIMSSEYDVVYVQEATELTEDDWEAITTRLRNGKISFQQLIADCNPGVPHHWLKRRCDQADTLMLYSRHEDNPILYNPVTKAWTERGVEYLKKLSKLTGVRKLRLRDGKWAAADGLIYEEWDPDVHLIDRFKIPDEWVRWWSIDFGYTNPQVIQFWAEDPDGRLYLYREIYRTRRTVDQHAKDIMGCVSKADRDYRHPDGADRYAYQGRTWIEPKPRGIICDHDAEGRAVLEREVGISTIAATKSVAPGIQAFQARLRPADDGKPRLFIFRDALVHRDPELDDAKKPCCTAEEIVGYVWDRGATAAAAEKPPKEAPLKENDHGMDGGRYMVAERDLGGRPRIRFF
jgi:phage terminase large subunit